MLECNVSTCTSISKKKNYSTFAKYKACLVAHTRFSHSLVAHMYLCEQVTKREV